MGIETKAVNDLLNEEDGIEPLFGQRRKNKRALPYPEETEFRFFLGCLNDEASRLEYESILTKSFRCQNVLEGFYHVVSRYAIIPENVHKGNS